MEFEDEKRGTACQQRGLVIFAVPRDYCQGPKSPGFPQAAVDQERTMGTMAGTI